MRIRMPKPMLDARLLYVTGQYQFAVTWHSSCIAEFREGRMSAGMFASGIN